MWFKKLILEERNKESWEFAMSESHEELLKPRVGKRTPSILVTDSRTQNNSSSSSPFTRTAPFSKRQSQTGNGSFLGSFQQHPAKNVNRRSKFANISVSNILSSNSNSGRVPALLSNTASGASILPMYNKTGNQASSTSASLGTFHGMAKLRTAARSSSTRLSYTTSGLGPVCGTGGVVKSPMPKLIQPLPPRTSKTSQKLVYIPEDEEEGPTSADLADFTDYHKNSSFLGTPTSITKESMGNSNALGAGFLANSSRNAVSSKRNSIRKATAEIKSSSNRNKDDLARVTAYFISEALDLDNAAQFLKDNHKVSTRLYDEVLYVPYQLPLLDGINGYRVRSGIYTKNSKGKSKVEDSIKTTELKDYHFEYYAGHDDQNSKKIDETDSSSEDNKNGSEKQKENNTDNKKNRRSVTFLDDFPNKEDTFDPHEPQYFTVAPPMSTIATESSTTSEDTIIQATAPQKTLTTNSEQCQTDETLRLHNNGNVKQDTGILGDGVYNIPVAQSSDRGELFLFNYGVIVFWNFTRIQEENILADLAFSRLKSSQTGLNDDYEEEKNCILINEINEQEIETEEFHFEYDKSTNVPRIYNDLITLKSEDHLIKMSLSHAIAQSTRLSRFESRMSTILYSVSKLPKILALTGELGLTREKLLRKSGKLFKLRVDVNLSSNVLDTPEFFWSFEPSLNPLYSAAREYLEIDERVMVINDRCKVFLEFTDVIAESIAENNMTKITWIIIIIIVISLMVSCLEIFIRYLILSRHR